MTTKTPNYKFELVDFNTKPWHTKEHNNWRIIDSVFSNFITVSDLQGIWENAIAVTVGQKYVDPDLDTMWKVLVAHTFFKNKQPNYNQRTITSMDHRPFSPDEKQLSRLWSPFESRMSRPFSPNESIYSVTN